MARNSVKVGIDLGTTNTLATYMKGSKLKPIKFNGSLNLPSVLYVKEDGKVIIGEEAMKQKLSDDKNGVRSSKTSMGDFSAFWMCRNRKFTPTDVASEILKEVKSTVKKKLKLDDDTDIEAVITIPAYFNSKQTDETRKAGEKAGLKILQIITEPMAAAICVMKDNDINGNVLVVDLGGGTFDLSLLQADEVNHEYKALGIGGDRKLGGDDFDNALLQYFKTIIREDKGVKLDSAAASGLEEDEYRSVINRLLFRAESVKIGLSESEEASVNDVNLFNYKGVPYDFKLTMTRKEFNDVCQPLYDRIFNTLDNFVREMKSKKGISLDDLSNIVLAGGSCEIPYIREEIERRFKCTVDNSENKGTLVVNGACIVADAHTGMMAGDENGLRSNISVKDILSHSLGVEDYKNNKSYFSPIIVKDTVFPCSYSKDYSTSSDYQDSVEINVYEAGSDGENEFDLSKKKHDFYGTFTLDGIEKAKAGIPKIRVTFSYDKSRCLTVVAEDMKTHAKRKIVVQDGAAPKQIKRSTQAPMDILVLLDSSYSMENNGAMNEAKDACRYLINKLVDLSVHRMGIVNFDDFAHIRSKLTHDKDKLISSLSNIFPSGGTFVLRALDEAMLLFDNMSNKRTKVLIIVTDGKPIDSPYSRLREFRNSGIRVIAIGAGQGVNDSQLNDMAGTDDAYKIADMKQLQSVFKTVMNKLTSL